MNIPVNGIDRSKLYDVSTVTDLVNGEIIVYSPITPEGDYDAIRQPLIKGRTNMQVQGPQGQFNVQLNFDLEGVTLAEAIANWPLALASAVERWQADMRKQAILNGARAPSKLDDPTRRRQ